MVKNLFFSNKGGAGILMFRICQCWKDKYRCSINILMNLQKSPSDVLISCFTHAEQSYVSFNFLWSPYVQKTITGFFLTSNIESSCRSDSWCWCWLLIYCTSESKQSARPLSWTPPASATVSLSNVWFCCRYGSEKEERELGKDRRISRQKL